MSAESQKRYRLMWRGVEASSRTIEEIKRGLARSELNTMYLVEVDGRWILLRDFLETLQDQGRAPQGGLPQNQTPPPPPPPPPQERTWPEPAWHAPEASAFSQREDVFKTHPAVQAGTTAGSSKSATGVWIGAMAAVLMLSVGVSYYIVNGKDLSSVVSESTETPDESPPTDQEEKEGASGNNKLDLQQAVQRWGGDEIDDNDPAAVEVFKEYADEGDPFGQFYYGLALYQGKGIKKDSEAAVTWFKKAAARSLSDAQFMLAAASLSGEGMKRDGSEAVEWLRKAAMQAHGRAQYVLGLAYIEGEYVPKDVIKGAAWVMLSAEAGLPEARELMAEIKKVMNMEGFAKVSRLVGELQSQMLSGEKVPFDPAMASNFIGQGTGFFITKDGYLVTNHHVINQASLVKVKTSKGLMTAEVVLTDPMNDLAVIKVDGVFSALPVHAGENVSLGSSVSTVGFPTVGLMGYSPKYAKGEITSMAGIRDDERYYQISLPVQPGNSGGALVNSKGMVVGVVSAKLDMKAMLQQSNQLPENVNYAVKSTLLMKLLKKLPDLTPKLLKADPKLEDPDEVVRRVEQSSVLILVK